MYANYYYGEQTRVNCFRRELSCRVARSVGSGNIFVRRIVKNTRTTDGFHIIAARVLDKTLRGAVGKFGKTTRFRVRALCPITISPAQNLCEPRVHVCNGSYVHVRSRPLSYGHTRFETNENNNDVELVCKKHHVVRKHDVIAAIVLYTEELKNKRQRPESSHVYSYYNVFSKLHNAAYRYLRVIHP